MTWQYLPSNNINSQKNNESKCLPLNHNPTPTPSPFTRSRPTSSPIFPPHYPFSAACNSTAPRPPHTSLQHSPQIKHHLRSHSPQPTSIAAAHLRPNAGSFLPTKSHFLQSKLSDMMHRGTASANPRFTGCDIQSERWRIFNGTWFSKRSPSRTTFRRGYENPQAAESPHS